MSIGKIQKKKNGANIKEFLKYMDLIAQLQSGKCVSSPENMMQLGCQLAPILPANSILTLEGNLGTGKTTFVRGFAQGLGIDSNITSPSFTIYNIYEGVSFQLLHLDAYRLKSWEEYEALMLEDFLKEPYYLVIEWPEQIQAEKLLNNWNFSFKIQEPGKHWIQLIKKALVF